METQETAMHLEYAVVERTQRDISIAVKALRRAIQREDRELGTDGLGVRLALIVDELLQWC